MGPCLFAPGQQEPGPDDSEQIAPISQSRVDLRRNRLSHGDKSPQRCVPRFLVLALLGVGLAFRGLWPE